MLNPLSVFKHTVFLSFYLILSQSQAQPYSSASTDAIGGAGRAAVGAGDVNYLNPAGLVHLKGRFFYSTLTKDDLSVGLSETSKEVILPASFSFYQGKQKNTLQQDVKTQEMRLSVADFVVDRFSMGITGVMNSTKIDDKNYNQTNGNVGFFWTPRDHIGAAVIFYNALGLNDNVPEEQRLQHQIGAGFNYLYQTFLRYRLDVVSAPNTNFGKATYMTGIETLYNEWIAFRLGYQNDVLNDRELFTQGLGFTGPVFSLNYAHQGNVKGKDFDRHSIDLLISF